MSDYRDYFIDGPGIDPDAPGCYRAAKKPRITVVLSKTQKRAYLALGGGVWLKRTLSEAAKSIKESTGPGKP
jgi:allophanate hydrolase subunit 2